MRVKMESKKGKSAVCWIYQYSKKSLWLVILLALISGAIAGSFILLALVSSSLLDVATGVKEGRLGVQIFFDCMSDLAAGSFEYFEQQRPDTCDNED